MNNSFVVVRGTLILDSTNSEVLISWAQDFLPIPLSEPCFDQFGELNRPTMNITGNDMILLVPGRCAIFARIKINTGTPFHTSTVESFDPTKQITSYVSSAIFDTQDQIIYYTIKTYQSSTTTLHSVDSSVSPMKPTPLSIDLALEQSETVLVLDKEAPTSIKLYVIASGSNKISRLLLQGSNYVSNSTAVLDSTINQISSALFYKPYLYYTTYEPDAKIVRINEGNFCPEWCQDTGYCSVGVCTCRPGFQKDPRFPALGCRYVTLIEAEKSQQTSENASIALGVLFGITVVVAIIGWSCWWRAKTQKSTYTSLVGGGESRL